MYWKICVPLLRNVSAKLIFSISSFKAIASYIIEEFIHTTALGGFEWEDTGVLGRGRFRCGLGIMCIRIISIIL